LVKLEKVPTYHNRTHNPEQSKVAGEIPILSKDSYNAATGELTLETGVFVKWPEKKTLSKKNLLIKSKTDNKRVFFFCDPI
jgi:hypothetical protein